MSYRFLLLRGGNGRKTALVDVEDYDKLSGSDWFVMKDRNIEYAARSIGNKRIEKLHFRILGIKNIDHINGDGLDNRRKNLRPATTRQNGQNRGKFAPAYSKFKGVSWHIRDRRWVASIRAECKDIWLGSFTDEKLAAAAYNKAAKKHFGSFARLNQI